MLMLPHIIEKLNGLLHTSLEVDVPYYVSIGASSYHSSDEMIYYTSQGNGRSPLYMS
jgi:hypothetical protein